MIHHTNTRKGFKNILVLGEKGAGQRKEVKSERRRMEGRMNGFTPRQARELLFKHVSSLPFDWLAPEFMAQMRTLLDRVLPEDDNARETTYSPITQLSNNAFFYPLYTTYEVWIKNIGGEALLPEHQPPKDLALFVHVFLNCEKLRRTPPLVCPFFLFSFILSFFLFFRSLPLLTQMIREF